MANADILLVEDEAAIQTLIRFHVQQAGFAVRVAASAEEALLAMDEALPDLLLVDWMLPGMSGVDLVCRLRADGNPAVSAMPVMLLTARGEDADKEQGLNQGADDYLTKPFSPRELVARVRALLRRVPPKAEGSGRVQAGRLCIDTVQQRVFADGVELACSSSEYRLLHFFACHAERVFSRQQLLDWVWGYHSEVEERTVDVQVGRVRKLLEPHGVAHYIQTVRGSGYRFSTAGDV